MKKFWEIFNNKDFNDFVDKTYVDIGHIEKPQNMGNISGEVDALIEIFPIFDQNSPCVGIYGLPGSGKSTLARQVSEKYNIPVISTDKFLADLREVRSDFPLAKHNDEFRKHEYKVICCLFLSDVAKNSIIDFGGAALLQPGLGLISKKFLNDKFINLKINSEDRVLNLVQDAILEQGHRTRIKNKTTEIKQQNEEKFKELSTDFIQLRQESKSLENIKKQIQSKFGEKTLELFDNIYKICEDFDKNNRWRLEVFKRSSEELDFKKVKEILGK